MHGVGLKRLPGDRRHLQRAKANVEGIALDPQTLANLRELAGL
jgi:delta1-piperideine-2-carboxylate reductase